MPVASDQRSLASMLAALTDAEVADLLAVRGIPVTASWRDLFDAAEGMLEPSAVSRALEAVPAPEAAALTAAVSAGAPVAAPARESLAARALTAPDGTVFQAVAEAVRDRAVVPEPSLPERPSSTEAEDAGAAEAAFTSAASLADLLLLCLDAPLGRIGTGSLGAVDRRRLVEAGAIVSVDDADPLLDLAEAGGLLVGLDRTFLVTARGRRWLGWTTAARWEDLATTLRDTLPAGLRLPSGGWVPTPAWPSVYPFDPAWGATAVRWRRRLTLWGMLTRSGAEPPWARPLSLGEGPDLPAFRELLPAEVDRVFLQNDLTAIAPGPLAPALDLRLQKMARRESRAQASTYRFSSDTVAAAITAGETAESLREFLQSLSLTGLPQPLAYVIDSTAARHGLVRVGADAASGLTFVESHEEAILATIGVDQTLRPLGLVRDAGRLTTRAARDAVFWALADARYPVVAVDDSGSPRTLDRAQTAPDVPAPTPLDRYAGLLSRLRDAPGDGDNAWLERELLHAVRARAVLDVVVALPDGTGRTFRLEATGFGGGRLRGRDKAADVERTVPLRSIRSVHPVV